MSDNIDMKFVNQQVNLTRETKELQKKFIVTSCQLIVTSLSNF